jgi:hypothetical protein
VSGKRQEIVTPDSMAGFRSSNQFSLLTIYPGKNLLEFADFEHNIIRRFVGSSLIGIVFRRLRRV